MTLISTEIPRTPEYKGDINQWSKELVLYIEKILRQHGYDLRHLSSGMDEIISVVYNITEDEGVPEVEGSWRMRIDSSGNLVFERYESSVWVEKGGVNA